MRDTNMNTIDKVIELATYITPRNTDAPENIITS